MLGDFFVVAVFFKKVRLPEGTWVDYWQGKRTGGPATLPVETTPTRVGALLMKSGAIIPTGLACDHAEKGSSSRPR
jgi:alpha-glucosidase (family GH31 glycosyl hydrolase)